MSVQGRGPAEAGRAPATWLVPTLMAAAFINTTSGVALGPFLPLVADELGMSVALLGQVPSAMMLLAALLGLVIGPLADQYGYRRTLVVGMLAVAISALGTGLAPGFVPLLLAGLVGALGRAAVMPTAQAILGMQYPDDDRRRRAISWVATGHTSSVLLGIPLLTAIAAAWDWRASFFVAGGLALGMVLLLGRMLAADGAPPSPAPRLRTVLAAYTPLLQHRPPLALIGQGFVGNAGTLAIFNYLGAYLVQRHDSTAQEIGGAYLVVGIGAVLGSKLVGSRLGARPRSLLIATRIGGGLLLGAALILPLPVLVAVGLVTVGSMAHTANTAAAATMLVGASPAGRATTMTVNSAGMSFGTACGGALGGLALALADYPAVGLISLAWLLAAAALVWWSRPHSVTVPDAVPA